MDLSRPFTFVTGNSNKVMEAQQVCTQYGISIEQRIVPIQEIQSNNPMEVAIDKAEQAYRLIGRSLIVNDSSWFIPALNGFPGAYMNDINKWFKPADFIRLMHGINDREIILTDTIVYYDGNNTLPFTVITEGRINDAPRGKSGVPSDKVISFDEINGLSISECKDTGIKLSDATSKLWSNFCEFVVNTEISLND